jgi:hypothetical protein
MLNWWDSAIQALFWCISRAEQSNNQDVNA